MLEWKKKVWKSFTENCPGHFLLLLDQFTGHMTQEVQDAIAAYRKKILLIPTGYTGKLQVLDVGLNKPFKMHVRNCFDECMIRHEDEEKRIHSRIDISNWVRNEW